MFDVSEFNDSGFDESILIEPPTEEEVSKMGGRNQVLVNVSRTSHGGVIITGSSRTFVNGVPLSRIGDLHACPIHGVNVIVTGSHNTTSDYSPNARLLDLTSCGSTIVSGSPNTFTNR
jgi:uncharacterized Zn-binding protein involved in type VI secretion